ncbi:MAG: aminopeptidase [Clostridia bacterium]|nr:aminopeptidase [Clostridia bacterium]
MNKTRLAKYAELIVKKGLNIQKGQYVTIDASVEQPEFTAMVVKKLYQAGAKSVFVEFYSDLVDKAQYIGGSVKALSEYESFETAKLEWAVDKLPAKLYIVSDDPDGLKGINQEKLMKVGQARSKVAKPYRDKIESKYQWCIAAAPGEKWAKKVFPNDRKSVAIEKLWQAILDCSLVTEDPIAKWNDFNTEIKKKCDYLNSLKLKKLYYKSSNGTDFNVTLNELGKFCGGYDTTLSGVNFNPNIPSLEIFTSPKYGACEGTVVATKPLSYYGQLIENFSITFKDGKVNKVHAEKNEELLKRMIQMDEGACMLGECALVPFDNPINNSGLLFYETLFDENACCHLALGRGFPDCLFGYENMTKEEQHKNGINDSVIHVDFMIGSADLEIIGETKDSKKITIFKNGNWA